MTVIDGDPLAVIEAAEASGWKVIRGPKCAKATAAPVWPGPPAPAGAAEEAEIIPVQLQRPDIRAILVRPGEKRAMEPGWPTDSNYAWDCVTVALHRKRGGNWAWFPAEGSRLVIIDADDRSRLEELGAFDGMPETFAVETGSSTPEHPKMHLVFEVAGEIPEGKTVIYDPATEGTDGHLGEVYAQSPDGAKGYCVGPFSVHPDTGRVYRPNTLPIATIPREQLDGFLSKVRLPARPNKSEPGQTRTMAHSGSFGGALGISITDIWPVPQDAREQGGEYQFTHPAPGHGSTTGTNYGYNPSKDVWHCHRDDSGGDALLALAVDAGILRCDEARPGALEDATRMGQVKEEARRRGFDVDGAERQQRADWLRQKAAALAAADKPPPAAPTETETPDGMAERALREEALALQCREYNTTDVGNGQRFAARFGDTVKHCYPRRTWLVWDGTRWKIDTARAVREFAKATARAINREVAIAPNPARLTELRGWARSSEAEPRLVAMLNMASTDPAISVLPDDLDANGDLFNFPNGTLELDTLTFREHRKEDMLTKVAGTKYDETATCPLWLKHLNLIFDGDENMVAGLQQFLGYCMLSGNPLQVFVLWWGDGENGKSVTLTVIRRIFGDYAYHCDADVFMDTHRDGTGARPELVALRGARLVTAAESGKGKALNEGLIKQHTGGDPITARGLYQSNETFDAEYTPILVTNHNPVVRGVEHAIWRRILRWPFTQQIPADKKVLKFEDRLMAEAPGIVNWLVEGLRQFYANGNRLQTPIKTVESTAAYRASQDVLMSFIVERCVIDPKAVTYRTDLDVAYKNWCSDNGEEKLTTEYFYDALEAHGWEQKRRKGKRFFHGIRLKNDEEQDAYDKAAETGDDDRSYQEGLRTTGGR